MIKPEILYRVGGFDFKTYAMCFNDATSMTGSESKCSEDCARSKDNAYERKSLRAVESSFCRRLVSVSPLLSEDELPLAVDALWP